MCCLVAAAIKQTEFGMRDDLVDDAACMHSQIVTLCTWKMMVLHKSLALDCHILPSRFQEVLLLQGDLQKAPGKWDSKGKYLDGVVCNVVITVHKLKVCKLCVCWVMLTVDSVDRRFCSNHEPEAFLYVSVGSNDAVFRPRRCK